MSSSLDSVTVLNSSISSAVVLTFWGSWGRWKWAIKACSSGRNSSRWTVCRGTVSAGPGTPVFVNVWSIRLPNNRIKGTHLVWFLTSSMWSSLINLWLCLFFSLTCWYVVQHLSNIDYKKEINILKIKQKVKCLPWVFIYLMFLPWGSCEQCEQSADGRRATAGKWPRHPERAGWLRFLGRSGCYLCSPTACELSEQRPRTHASNTTPDPEGERVWCDQSVGKLRAGSKNIINLIRFMKPPGLLYFIVIGKRRQYLLQTIIKIFVSLLAYFCLHICRGAKSFRVQQWRFY